MNIFSLKLYSTFLLLGLLNLGIESRIWAAAPDFVLSVSGIEGKTLQLTLSELAKMPRRTVKAKDHDGKDSIYEGVELREIMARVGVTFGKELRGKLLASVVLVKAADNYQTVFALPEIDSFFTQKVILLADTYDGKPLSSDNGPLQLIVPDEKRHARWVRQVSTLTVVQAEKKK